MFKPNSTGDNVVALIIGLFSLMFGVTLVALFIGASLAIIKSGGL